MTNTKQAARAILCVGEQRKEAIQTILQHHYTRSVSSGKTHYFGFESCVISFSIPANKNIAKFLLGRDVKVWELSRLWAPDGHERNLLTRAISAAIKELRRMEPDCEALVSYADPNVGHTGGVYRSASWVPLGRSEEVRYYIKGDEIAARRKFHSGRNILRKAEIEALGWTEAKMPGKYRYAKGICRKARKDIARRFKTA